MLKRIPNLRQIAPVYAVIVLMLYGWTILWFLWKLPSWLFFMTVPEILEVFAFAMVNTFLESLVVLSAPVLLSLALPGKWFHEMFVVRGASFVFLSLGYLMFFAFQFQEETYPKLLLFLTPGVFVVIFCLVYFAGKSVLVRRVIESFADRAVIFLYLLIPISVIAVLFIILRQIL
ncbi:MAG: hypothetical protein WA821_13935 [Anaerolineales bacterium]